jgi:hypothetical protein
LLSKFLPPSLADGSQRCGGTDKLTSVPPALRYDVATLYMQQADWDFDAAIEAYKEDERWEKEHPMQAHEKGKKAKSVGMRRFVGSGANAAGAAR